MDLLQLAGPTNQPTDKCPDWELSDRAKQVTENVRPWKSTNWELSDLANFINWKMSGLKIVRIFILDTIYDISKCSRVTGRHIQQIVTFEFCICKPCKKWSLYHQNWVRISRDIPKEPTLWCQCRPSWQMAAWLEFYVAYLIFGENKKLI